MAIIFLKEQKYLPLIKKVAQETGVQPALILAHIKQESSFNPNAFRAESKLRDASYGLMQVLLKTAKSIDSSATATKLYDPEYNIRIGSTYISQNLNKYKNIPDAIAAYNSGVAKIEYGRYVSRTGTDVQPYVNKVMNNYNMYLKWLNEGAVAIKSDPLLISIIFFGVMLALKMWRRNAKNNRIGKR